MFLSDQETDVDLLYHEAIARTVIKLIRESPEVPITIGVHGDWGAGKSSVLKMTAASFKEEKRVICLWFNGWTFEGFEDAKTVVIETIVEELRRARPASTKVADAARKVLKRIDWLKMAKRAGGYAFTAATGIPTLDQLQGLADAARAFVAKPQDQVSLEDIKGVAGQIGECIRSSEEEADHLPEQIHLFRQEFEQLLDAAEIDQLVVIVDDLDRCLPETSIATLEAIRLFLFVPRTAFVIGADELMIEYAVRAHFPDLPPSSGPVPYARNYLEKLIQVPFRIPALGSAETRIYVTLLLAEAALGPKDARFLKLLEAARKDLQRPWKSSGLDRSAITKALASIPTELEPALAIGSQISRILSDGTRGNPRQIKRFLNSMMLRQAIAEERGFADDIKIPVLAKLMLAERFSSEVYDQIVREASGAADGNSASLAELEAQLRAGQTPESKPPKGAKKAAAPSGSDELSEKGQQLAASEWTRYWAAIEPPLGTLDLRPYIFVTRDKRGYLGGLAAAGHLAGLVEQLLGKRIVARAASLEVAKLTGQEPEQVFDAIVERILQTDKYDTLPDGVEGLSVLVTTHEVLRPRLLTFVKGLPTAKLGAWVATSWGKCFSDGHTAIEFKALLEDWSKQTANKVLQASAAGAIRLRAGGG